MNDQTQSQRTKPILLFNDECGVCRRIGHWVTESAKSKSGESSLIVQPIGDDPDALGLVAPDLDIWDAYATIHLVMPDGSMRLGGEAVAEVLRSLRNTRWFSWLFAVRIFGFRPFQSILNLGYAILAGIRPLFGCESCGRPSRWLQPFVATKKWVKSVFGKRPRPHPSPVTALHSTPMSVLGHRRRASAA
jgi:hypothetical protein